MNILGLCGFIHHSSATLMQNGRIVAAADEERFTREKFTGRFPREALAYCLHEGGLSLAEVEAVAFYWNPWSGILPRLHLMAKHVPHSLAFFQKRDGLAVRGDFQSWWNMVHVGNHLRSCCPGDRTQFRTHHVEHHLAHAASAYYVSGWEEALVLSIDGTGEWTTTLFAHGKGNHLHKLREIPYPHSLGVLYGAFTQFLGYRIYEDEWKVMGLAALGKPRYREQIRRLARFQDGQLELNLSYFHFQYADKGTWYGPKFIELFGPARCVEEPLESGPWADLAASLQAVTEEIGLAMVRYLLRLGGGCRKLCLAGGVTLNAVLNGKILTETDVEDIFIQPAAADNGAALGAALYIHHSLYGGARSPRLAEVKLGPAFDETAILHALRGVPGIKFEKCEQIERRTAAMLVEGKVIGWFQGRMEFGPRALGNRSILADPRRAEMKDRVNAKVKFREGFRPFAPAILAEQVQDYFLGIEKGRSFPFMTVVLPIRPEKQAEIPAVTHFDGTGRLQTVEASIHPRFHALIQAFDRLTGVPVVLNTSFNLAGEPIVCRPEEAISTFLRSGLDALVLGDYLCLKTD